MEEQQQQQQQQPLHEHGVTLQTLCEFTRALKVVLT
jgi:hypothetical protein